MGPEAYQRRICRDALLDRLLPGETRTDGFTRIDLEETSLAEVLDDARSLSLFAADRVIWVSSAELALPRRLSSAGEDEDGPTKSGAEGLIASYLKAPTPGTTSFSNPAATDIRATIKLSLTAWQSSIREFRMWLISALSLLNRFAI